MDGAIEAEADAICDADGNVYIIGIMEHIEPCGIHSGDSMQPCQPFNLGDLVMQQIKDHTHKIAVALNTVGLINIQFASKMIWFISLKPIQELSYSSFYSKSIRRTLCELCNKSYA